MPVAADSRKFPQTFAMTSLHVEETPTKTGARLRIKYNETTIALNYLLTCISVLLKLIMQCLIVVAFLDTLYIHTHYYYSNLI